MACAVAFLLYPRETRFSIESFDIDAHNSTFTDGDQLMSNWLSTVAVINRNYYPIEIREMNVRAYVSGDRRAAVGKGHGANLRFPALRRSLAKVAFHMPVYAPSSGQPSLIIECMKHDKVDLFLEADLDLSLTHWTGKWIHINFYATVDCKIPALGQLIGQRAS